MIETMLEEAATELSLHLILIWISCSSIFFEVRNTTEWYEIKSQNIKIPLIRGESLVAGSQDVNIAVANPWHLKWLNGKGTLVKYMSS